MRRHSSRFHRVLLIAIALSSVTRVIQAQRGTSNPTASRAPGENAPVSSSGTFITRLGTDTVALETFTRTASSLEGDVIFRSPEYAAARYRVRLSADGRPTEMVITILDHHTTNIGAYRYHGATIAWSGDTVTGRVRTDTGEVVGGAVRGAFPTLPYSWALHELTTLRLRREGVDSTRYPIFAVGTRRALIPSTIRVVRVGADSVRLWNVLAAGALHLRVDEDGRILGADGYASTSRYVVERQSQTTDLGPLIASIGAAERAGNGFGSVIAVYDTARAMVGGGSIEVYYSPPKVRGRDVFRNGVLGDTLWRTGANRATHLRTQVDLVIGGQRVPAGLYTLFTSIASDNSRYTLIVNTQTNQWGYTYDPARDLLRVPLVVGRIPHTERFTIAIEPNAAGDGGTLALRWAATELTVPFSVAGRDTSSRTTSIEMLAPR